MKDVLTYRRVSAGSNRKLCKPFGYAEKQEIAFTKQFPLGGYTISLRPFCIATDLGPAYEWIRHEYGRRSWQTSGPVSQLEEVYRQMMQCDFAQPFMVLQDNVPICLAELYQSKFHELSLYYDVQPGDYDMVLMMAPKNKRDTEIGKAVLQTCLHYCFNFPEVERLIAEVNVHNEPTNGLFNDSGFRLMHRADMLYKTVNLYYFPRSAQFKKFAG
jgi:hypothetical protein